MTGENPKKITYKQLWDSVFEGYDKSEPQLKRIFNTNSDYNKRLIKYAELCNELEPDFDNELQKLGFTEKMTVEYPDYFTPGSEDFYSNDKGDTLQISGEGNMLVTFNDYKVNFECDIVGENERMALRWIKEINEAVNETDKM